MAMQFEDLRRLVGYQYRLWEYHVSHSVLTIKATLADRPRHNVYIHFAEVYYVQLPTTWKGDFRIGSDDEFREFMAKAGLQGDYEVQKAVLSLFKADTGSDTVYILGTIISIEYDVEPL